MLNIGLARMLVSIENPATTKDGMGAPTMTWTEYATAYAEIEGDETSESEAQATGPRREISRTMTLIIRIHNQQSFTPAMRVKTHDGKTFAITGVRYDAKRTTAYLDVVGGVSSGGVP